MPNPAQKKPAVVRTVAALRRKRDQWKRDTVALVPTMGALHEGHASLVRAARATTDLVVVTVFVNPLQFGAGEDLDRYPRDLDSDLALCAREGADIVFAPSVAEMYPAGPPATTVHVDGLTAPMCGAARPTHFDGVSTVVTKLFAIAQADRGYFGQKDAQQLMVIRRLVQDLRLPVEVVGCAIVREPDGLALSSRNGYLSPAEREEAPRLYRQLQSIRTAILAGNRDCAALERQAIQHLHAVIGGHHAAQVAAVVAVNAVDEAADWPPRAREDRELEDGGHPTILVSASR